MIKKSDPIIHSLLKINTNPRTRKVIPKKMDGPFKVLFILLLIIKSWFLVKIMESSFQIQILLSNVTMLICRIKLLDGKNRKQKKGQIYAPFKKAIPN